MKKRTTPLVLVAAFVAVSGTGIAQVSNGDFTNAKKAPRNFGQIEWSTGWSNANGGTGDFYHKNASKCSNMGIPENRVGNQAPFAGDGYAGIITYYNDASVDLGASISNMEVMEGKGYGKYSEYLTTELGAALTAGKSYTFTYYVSLAENSGYAVNGFGALFSNDAVAQKSNAFISATPQITTTNVVSSKSEWTKITGTFVAKGGERYVTIGVFNGPKTINTVSGGKGINGLRAYYFVDGVSLAEGGAVEKDSDGDGVADKNDPCPTVYGTINGCPDSDGDGVADNVDDCPTVYGTVKGCPENDPDSDGDGVADSRDKCPTVKGTINGCPDSDGDGIADNEDACPTVYGKVKGCPDSDGDGVADKDDECPEIFGTVALNGCALSKSEREVIRSASEAIYFNTGSAVIKTESYPNLDRLAEILVKHPEVKADVEGHTDSQGNDAANLTLSKNRAKAVKDYLISKGVQADHIASEGYGETQPIADNATTEGRAKNRRVIVKTSMYKVK